MVPMIFGGLGMFLWWFCGGFVFHKTFYSRLRSMVVRRFGLALGGGSLDFVFVASRAQESLGSQVRIVVFGISMVRWKGLHAGRPSTSGAGVANPAVAVGVVDSDF